VTHTAHRRASSPVCTTCQRRDRLLALAVIVVFVAVFAVPMLAGWR
jgi:hypothetical protein